VAVERYERQLDVMRDQNRPWIRAKITFAGPLEFTDWAKQKFLNVSLNFDLKNFGDIPARNIRISTFVSAHPGTAKKRQLDDWEAAACKQAREMADSDKIGGVASFPSEPVTVETGGGSGPVYQDGQPMIFSILGCVDYTYSDDRHGTTGFRKTLGRVEGNRVVGLPFVVGTPRVPSEPISPELLASGYPKDPPIIGEMPTDNVWFKDEDSGNYAR
jgi:hypothetical protein